MKALLGIIFLVILGSSAWFVTGLIEDREKLSSQVSSQQQTISNFNDQVDRQEETIESYLESLEESNKRRQKLDKELEGVSGRLEECLSVEASESVIDTLFNYGRGGVQDE